MNKIGNKTVIKGRSIIGGIAEGEALVCPDSIQGWAGMNGKEGTILEKGHVHEGVCIKDKVLIMPCSKGSCGWSGQFHSSMENGYSPSAWVFTKVDSRVGVGAVVLDIPTVGDFEGVDPCEVIKDGDWVKVDGDKGEVTIIRD